MSCDPRSEERLRLLVDREQIADLTLRYAAALDTNDWVLLASCFTDDATARYGEHELDAGPHAIVSHCRAAIEDLDAVQHIVANRDILVDNDAASVTSYLHAIHTIQRPDDGGYIVHATYRDRVVRTVAGWRIQRRERLRPVWSEGDVSVLGGPAGTRVS